MKTQEAYRLHHILSVACPVGGGGYPCPDWGREYLPSPREDLGQETRRYPLPHPGKGPGTRHQWAGVPPPLQMSWQSESITFLRTRVDLRARRNTGKIPEFYHCVEVGTLLTFKLVSFLKISYPKVEFCQVSLPPTPAVVDPGFPGKWWILAQKEGPVPCAPRSANTPDPLKA